MASINSNTDLRKHVLSYPVDLVDQTKALSVLEDYWQRSSGLHVITLNAEMVVVAQEDSGLGDIIRKADLVIPDGAGIVLALKLQGCDIARLPGIELARAALQFAAKKGIPVALIGSAPEVLNDISQLLPQEIPELKLVFCQDGYFDANKETEVINKLSDSKALLALVATGVPRQEYFIGKALNTCKHTIFIGVGGSFDVWAGKKQRAPQFWQNYHLEWLYRLISEPWRFQRMSSTLPSFFWQIIIEFLHNKANKND